MSFRFVTTPTAPTTEAPEAPETSSARADAFWAAPASLGLPTPSLAPPPTAPGAESAFVFLKPKTTEEAHAHAISRGARCKECPLYGCGRGPVPSSVVRNAKLTLVAEAPGPNEVLKGENLVGWSGGEVNQALASGGLMRSEVTLANTIACQPPGDGSYTDMEAELLHQWKRSVKAWARRKASAEEVGALFEEEAPPKPLLPAEACRPRLERDLIESNSKVVLAVGRQALQACAEMLDMAYDSKPREGQPFVASIKKQHGAPVFAVSGRVLMSAYHPAMGARDKREWLPVIRENIARAAWVARNDGHIEWSEPKFYIGGTPDEIVNIADYFREHRLEVAVDIETDSLNRYTSTLKCIGFGATLSNGHEAICVAPLAAQDKRQWWSDAETARIRRAIGAMLDDDLVPLAGQNFNFDTSVLLNKGIMHNRRKPWTDLALLHHDTEDNDLPHNLSFMARRYFCAPMWKNDVDLKNVGDVPDVDLHLYNARDVLWTMRLLKPLRERVTACDSWAQYQTDYELAPILREMGDLGMVIDEHQRGEFSSMLNKRVGYHFGRLREMAGVAGLNPGSPDQLRDLLYDRWGYTPVLATDGYEWEEGDDGSTSAAALIELDKRIAPPGEAHPHRAFIEELLEFRAYDKLRGTYTDNLQVRDVDWAAFGCVIDEAAPVIEQVWSEKHGRFIETEILGRRSGLSLLNTIYKAFLVPTGRLSTEPAIQNWPVLGKANMRKMGVAPPGHVIVGADYEQIEARIYAAMSGDSFMARAIANGWDLHSLNAATLVADTEDEIWSWYLRINDPSPSNKKTRKYWRTVAKNFGFLEIYGGEEKTLFTTMAQKRNKEDGKLTFPDITPEIVDLWHRRWHRMHPETRQWHAACHALLDQTGYACVPTLDGRKRWFPAGPSKKNAVPNMTIQGFAASIANRALLRIAEKIPVRGWSYWSGPFLQVHDYIGCYVPEGRAEEAKKIIEDAMFFQYNGFDFFAKAEVSRDWAAQG